MLVEPVGARANSWEDVADLSYRAGVTLDGWQELILRSAMGERSDSTWAAKRVGVSVPRQNGKSQLLVARALAGVLLFGELKIVVSAHQQDTARETFSKMVEILEADGNGWLMDRVRPNGIMNAINREAIRFKNGASIQFKARSGAGGRGFSSDCLLLDEAQRLKRPAWVSINSTMSAMPNPQVWLLGTPPTREDVEAQMGDVFESVRSAAVVGVSKAAAWLEWGADPGSPDYDPASDLTRWQANPAWNTRINHEVVDGEFESYSEEEFAQDRLGVWLSDIGGSGTRAISEREWSATGVAEAPADGVRVFAVAFNIEGTALALAGGLKHDGGVHVELIDVADGDVAEGLGALADWLAARWRSAAQIVLSGAAGAPVLAQLLKDRQVPDAVVKIANTVEYTTACSVTLDAVRASAAAAKNDEPMMFTHLASEGQSALDESVAISDKKLRSRSSGAWGWSATTDDGDETPVEAVSLAYWLATSTKRKPYGEKKRKAVIL